MQERKFGRYTGIMLDALNILYNAEHKARHNLSDPAGDLLLIMIDTAAPFDQESKCFSFP